MRWLSRIDPLVALPILAIFGYTLINACSQVTATDRARAASLALDHLAEVCPSYVAGKSGIPETPELTAVCAALLREPAPMPIVESRDGG